MGNDLELKRKDIRKLYRIKKEKKDIFGKKRGIEKIRAKKDNKKIGEIKGIVKSLLLSKKEKITKSEKIIEIKKDDVYKPIKIYEAFDGDFIEYQSNSKKDKSVSISSYLNNIREYLKKLINSNKQIGE